jgi:hypothetical protein
MVSSVWAYTDVHPPAALSSPIPAVLAICPDTAPIGRVMAALTSVGLRTVLLHSGVLSPRPQIVREATAAHAAAHDRDETLHSATRTETTFQTALHLEQQSQVTFREAVTMATGTDDDTYNHAPLMSSTEHLHRRAAFLRSLQLGEVDVVITTENNARGLDIPGLLLSVLLFSPDLSRDFVHLVGRVGRVGMPGLVVSVVSEREVMHCLPKHAQCLSLELQEWVRVPSTSIVAPGQELVRHAATDTTNDATAAIMAAASAVKPERLTTVHWVPAMLELLRTARLSCPSAIHSWGVPSVDSTAPQILSPLLQAVSRAREPVATPVIATTSIPLWPAVLALPASSATARVISGKSLQLAQRLKAEQRSQRRHQRAREDLSVRFSPTLAKASPSASVSLAAVDTVL